MFDFGIIKVKKEVKAMFNLCQKRAQSIGRAEYIRTNGEVSLVDIYREDVLKFLVFLKFYSKQI